MPAETEEAAGAAPPAEAAPEGEEVVEAAAPAEPEAADAKSEADAEEAKTAGAEADEEETAEAKTEAKVEDAANVEDESEDEGAAEPEPAAAASAAAASADAASDEAVAVAPRRPTNGWYGELDRALSALETAMRAHADRVDAEHPDEDTQLPSAAIVEAPEAPEELPVMDDEELPAEAPDVAHREDVAEEAEEEEVADLGFDADPRLAAFEQVETTWDTLEALHDDVHRLFRMGDVVGALISLERLVILSGREPRIDVFLERNEERLLGLYRRVFDGFAHRPSRADDMENQLYPDLRSLRKIRKVWVALDGTKTVDELLEAIGGPKVETAAVLHHLMRTRRLRMN